MNKVDYTGKRILFSPQAAIVSAITENFGAGWMSNANQFGS